MQGSQLFCQEIYGWLSSLTFAICYGLCDDLLLCVDELAMNSQEGDKVNECSKNHAPQCH